MLKIKNLYIDPYKISAYKLNKDDKGYYFTFYIDGREFPIDKHFKTEKEAFDWLECIERDYPDTFLMPDSLTNQTSDKPIKHKVKSYLEQILAIITIIFLFLALSIGAVTVLKGILNFITSLF